LHKAKRNTAVSLARRRAVCTALQEQLLATVSTMGFDNTVTAKVTVDSPFDETFFAAYCATGLGRALGFDGDDGVAASGHLIHTVDDADRFATWMSVTVHLSDPTH
jgi:hypothetical protein